jgi:hypothetical protein
MFTPRTVIGTCVMNLTLKGEPMSRIVVVALSLTLTLTATASLLFSPVGAPAQEPKAAGPAKSAASALDVDKAVAKLLENAMSLKDYLDAPKEKKGHCAAHIRDTLKAGHLDVTGHPVDAKDYGPFLEKKGFTAMPAKDYKEKKGDIVVLQPYKGGSKSGHIAMYDGTQWVSDFKQADFWGGSGYRNKKPPHTFYRWSPTPDSTGTAKKKLDYDENAPKDKSVAPKDTLAGTVWVGKGSKFGRPVETKLVFKDGQKFEWSTDGQVWSSGRWTEKKGYHFIDTGKSGIWRAKVNGDRMLVELTRADGGVSSGGYEFSKQK